MPPLPPVNKVVRLDMIQSIGNDVFARDRIFFSFAGAGPTVADMTTWLNTVSTQWNTQISPVQSTQAALSTLTGTDLTSPTGTQVSITASHPGTNATQIGSGAVAAVIKFKIARRYRGGHPRLYLGGIPTTNLTNMQLWSSTFVGALATAWNAFIGGVTTTPPASFGAMSHVNVSYFTGFTNVTNAAGRARPKPTLRGTPLQDTVLSYTVNPKPASQRRRNLQSP